MANVPTTSPTLAQIQDSANQLFAEVQNKGVDASKPSEIVASAKQLLSLLDQLQPHLNKAQTAFGGQDSNVQKINDLRNRVNRVIATYSA